MTLYIYIVIKLYESRTQFVRRDVECFLTSDVCAT